jgi:hypothetical protein
LSILSDHRDRECLVFGVHVHILDCIVKTDRRLHSKKHKEIPILNNKRLMHEAALVHLR